MMEHSKSLSVKACLTMIGGILIYIAVGGVYTVGNLNSYVTSYIRARSSPSTQFMAETTWVQAVEVCTQVLVMCMSGIIMEAVGPTLASLIGGMILSGGVMLTYFSIKWSFAGFLITYGFLYGAGIGITYTIPSACAMQWMPKNKGLVSGVVLTGYGAGAFVVTQIQTMFINPGNLVPDDPPNMTVPLYFSQDVLLDRVPYVFLVLGGFYLALFLVASPMISVPSENTESQPLLEEHGTDMRLEGKHESRIHESTEDKNISENDNPGDFSVSQTLRSRYFYMLWVITFLTGLSVGVATDLYKVYAESYIEDDVFLGVVGSCAHASSSIGRIAWGLFSDRFTFRIAMTCQCACTVVLFTTFLVVPLSPEGQKPMTFIWVCLIYFTYSGINPLIQAAIASTFGNKSLVTNIGLVFSSFAFSFLTASFFAIVILPRVGWVGLFLSVACCSLIAGVLTFFFDAKTLDGSPV